MTEFAKNCLAVHNELRAKHGAPALKLSDKLTEHAQKWAEHLASLGQLQHSHGSGYGENIAVTYGPNGGADKPGKAPVTHNRTWPPGNISPHSCELLAWSRSGAGVPRYFVEQWYNEVERYDFGDKSGNFGQSSTGHFSQVVWKETEELGVGMAKRENSNGMTKYMMVCNYSPPGNMLGAFRDNDKFVYVDNMARFGCSVVLVCVSVMCGILGVDSQQKVTEFAKNCLAAHNELRAKHGAPALKLSDKLTEHAQKWAEYLASIGKLQHSQGSGYGENIAMYAQWGLGSADKPARYFVEQWYSEVDRYDFAKSTYQPGTGHFSQVVWKGSKELGVGTAKRENWMGMTLYVTVCNYSPRGNMLGAFRDNVQTEN
ncbi:PREDICTED: peptidase inhibitor 16-like [Branchiostoma belcheri]|uniref:Peptidase inhibitor 16-like n=1 Tax=Branchiostoma belcheri TaxID=7741 RepID=A0A6P5A1L7_BRABE|nr:PREDICTED: peptidase inhibitor 16-like [Branchiostoma belcheri]